MSTQREIAEAAGLPVHPPKVEVFDLNQRTNTDPKGHVREVDDYRERSFGLYLARPMVDYRHASYVESWLLPELGLRVSDWWWKPGHHRDQDFYLDIVNIEVDQHRWRTTDYYLDIVVRGGREAELIDTEEFLQAVRCGLLDGATARHAMHIACTAIDGLAQHNYDLPAWLSTMSIDLEWQPRQ